MQSLTRDAHHYSHPPTPARQDAPATVKAAGTEDPEAYAGRGALRALALSTTSGACFISLKKEVPLRHRLHNDGLTGQSLPVSPHDIRFRVDLDLGQGIVHFEVALLNGAAPFDRDDPSLQAELMVQ